MDYEKDVFCLPVEVNIAEWEFAKIPLKDLPKPSEIKKINYDFFKGEKYQRAAAKKILEISQAIEKGNYHIKLNIYHDRGPLPQSHSYLECKIESFEIKNNKGNIEKLI